MKSVFYDVLYNLESDSDGCTCTFDHLLVVATFYRRDWAEFGLKISYFSECNKEKKRKGADDGVASALGY